MKKAIAATAVLLCIMLFTGCQTNQPASPPQTTVQPSLQPSPTPTAEPDYAIKWKDKRIEWMVRYYLDRPAGDIMRSDLDFAKTIRISAMFMAINNSQKYGKDQFSESDLYQEMGAFKTDTIHCEDFLNFKNLESLNIANVTQIDGIDKLAASKSLTSLTIDTEQPDIGGIAKLGNIKELRLTTSSILPDGTLPDGTNISALIGGMKNLTSLYLTSNVPERANLDPGALSGMTQLESLSLFNFNVGSLDTLSKLTKLTTLRLSNLDIADLGPLSGLTGLKNLYLAKLDTSELGPLSGLSSLTTLKLVSLKKVSSYKPISGLTNLSELSVEDCGGFTTGTISGLTNLTRLYLPKVFADTKALASLTKLEWLDLHGCNLETDDLKALSGLTNLKQLYLNENRILDLSPISTLTNLETLDISMNTSMDNLMPLFIKDLGPLKGMKRLKTLTSDNNMAIPDFSVLADLPIETVSLMNCNLGGENIGTLAGLKNLKSLNLGGTITLAGNLTQVSKLTGLEVLILSACPITDIRPIANLTNLRILKLSNTRVKDLKPLAGMTKLEALYLNVCDSIEDFGPLASLTELKSLSIKQIMIGKDIKNFDAIANLKNLMMLNLSRNMISSMEPIAKLENLRLLDLRQAQPADALPPLSSVKEFADAMDTLEGRACVILGGY